MVNEIPMCAFSSKMVNWSMLLVRCKRMRFYYQYASSKLEQHKQFHLLPVVLVVPRALRVAGGTVCVVPSKNNIIVTQLWSTKFQFVCVLVRCKHAGSQPIYQFRMQIHN